MLPPFARDGLEITDAQKKQLDDLQMEVDDKLAKILTDEQKKKLREIRERGPFGPGGPFGRFGGPRGPGGFGPPPGGPGGPPKKDCASAHIRR